jgi:outer membrane protein assembly factor BamB
MNRHKRGNDIGAYLFYCSLLLVIIAFIPSVAATDAMFRADLQHTGVYDNGGITPTNTELWRFATGGTVLLSPTVTNGVVYVGSPSNNMYAIDATMGTEKWRFTTGGWVTSSPAVADSVVYFGSWDNNVYAIDTATGKEKWRFATGDRVESAPAIANSIVYVGSDDKNLYAIDAATGKEKWRFTTGGDVLSSPAVSNGVVYIGSKDKNLYAIDAATGKEKWQFATGGEVWSSPAVINGVVYVGSVDKNLYAINAVTGKEKWQFTTRNQVSSSPAVSNGVVYIGSWDNNLYAIDMATGNEKWQFTTGSGVLSSPAVANGVVYIGSDDNNLYAIDATTGTQKWRFATGNYVTSCPTVANGVVYVGSYDTNLYAIGQKPSTPITIPTTAPTPVPPTPSPEPNPNPLISPIIIIFGVLLLAGGGYGIYRIKRKPSGAQLLEPKKDKAITLQPVPTISSSRAGDSVPARTSVKPTLALTLDRTQLAAGEWHKVGIQIKNTGDAHANGVSLSFSDDFDTRWIEPIEVKSGETAVITSGIMPKKKGNIPLEISCSYKDNQDQPYQQKFRFWIDVVDRMTSTPGLGAATPSPSPVSQFSPKPLTPKQLPPDLADRYTESEFIGKGGFARVFKAKRKDGKLVAVKIPISMDAMTGKSFIAEMQNWTKLSHPNIVRLFDFNIMPMPYFEEELCDSALADQSKPIESEEAAWILFNICEGLKFAHDRKIIHRDLKPQNILLKNGVPKISDWGLSRIISESTTTSATSFTPYYAAPEQINNRAKDERTDIWQLGVILYELVTGVLPFKGDSMVEIGMNIATKDPKRPGEIKPNAQVIDTVVMKCLEKDPKNRYQSVLDLQKDLAMFLRQNYAELLKTSVSVQDFTRSASYCGDLVMINMLTGDIPTAYKYLLDFVHYSKGDVKSEARELSEQIKMRMEMGVTEIPDELITKAEIIVHKVSLDFRKSG